MNDSNKRRTHTFSRFSMKTLLVIVLLNIVLLSNCFAWEGYDYDSGNYINIESREGREIEYYDYEDGEYHTGEIQDWGYNGHNNELEVYDYDSGEYRTFDMERE